jgi:hypothetical protein
MYPALFQPLIPQCRDFGIDFVSCYEDLCILFGVASLSIHQSPGYYCSVERGLRPGVQIEEYNSCCMHQNVLGLGSSNSIFTPLPSTHERIIVCCSFKVLLAGV